jgi:hypothetical protein
VMPLEPMFYASQVFEFISKNKICCVAAKNT